MIHSVAFTLGYLLMILCAMAAGALLIIGVAKLVNRATWCVVDCYGGLKTLREFQCWHRTNQRTCAKSQTDPNA